MSLSNAPRRANMITEHNIAHSLSKHDYVRGYTHIEDSPTPAHRACREYRAYTNPEWLHPSWAMETPAASPAYASTEKRDNPVPGAARAIPTGSQRSVPREPLTAAAAAGGWQSGTCARTPSMRELPTARAPRIARIRKRHVCCT